MRRLGRHVMSLTSTKLTCKKEATFVSQPEMVETRERLKTSSWYAPNGNNALRYLYESVYDASPCYSHTHKK